MMAAQSSSGPLPQIAVLGAGHVGPVIQALMKNIELYGTEVIPRVRELLAESRPASRATEQTTLAPAAQSRLASTLER